MVNPSVNITKSIDDLIADIALNNEQKGQALTDLVCNLFKLVPGITISHTNCMNFSQNEEIDIVIWNEQLPMGLKFLPPIIIIECKNWSKPVGSPDVSWFDRKIEDKGQSFGILIALNGITGNSADLTHANKTISDALKRKRQIIVLTSSDIKPIQTAQDLINVIQRKMCDLIAYA